MKFATYVVSNFSLDDVDQNVEEWYSLDHHRPVASWEDATAEGEDQLRHDTPSQSQFGLGLDQQQLTT